MPKPPIQRLAEQARDTRGIDHSIAVMGLKGYIDMLSEQEFLHEILRVDNADLFGQLWSAGLKNWQQEIVMERAKELEK